MRALEWLLRLVFPPKCVLCRRLLEKEETDLCRSCRNETPQWSEEKSLRFVDDYTAVWYYEGHVRESLLRFKFSNARSYADAYGRLIAMRVRQELPEDISLVTWVPIGPRRKYKRGYDQCQLLAQAVGKELELPVHAVLRKAKDNPAQSTLPDAAQRRTNVLGVYSILQPVKGKQVLLLDDIITTGATVSEAARMLRQAGAKRVYVAAVAAGRNQSHWPEAH